jgi:proteasome assembly chaperone (PAC2) family protein
MPDPMPPLRNPWMIAVWPGMGQVAINAGIYLLSKLQMTEFAEFQPDEAHDIESVTVKEGLIQPPRRPRDRSFLWSDPAGERDLIVFLGEAQPQVGKFTMCRRLIAFAREQGVERVITFAAMATQMHPEQRARVFGAATDTAGVAELRRLEVELLEEGQISGLNGTLLGAAQERGLRGTCLLGEMPHIFHQLPFPKASLAILEMFATMSGVTVDFTELSEQSQSVERQLAALLAKIEEQLEGSEASGETESFLPEPQVEEEMSAEDRGRIETLFAQTAKDRAKAFELKQLLDKLGVFREYEDRFLDLFRKTEESA